MLSLTMVATELFTRDDSISGAVIFHLVISISNSAADEVITRRKYVRIWKQLHQSLISLSSFN